MRVKLQILWVLAVPIIVSSCSKSPESTGIEYAPEMYHAIALEPYSQRLDSFSPFADKMNVQAPLPGTISREGWADYPFEEMDTTGPKTNPNPIPLTPETLKEGEVLYTRNCAICHGATGAGDGKVAEKDEINPPSLLAGKWLYYTPGQVYHVIMYGKNIMGAYASQLTYSERWKVIHYVEELQGRHAAPAVDSVATPAADSAAVPAPGVKPKVKPGHK